MKQIIFIVVQIVLTRQLFCQNRQVVKLEEYTVSYDTSHPNLCHKHKYYFVALRSKFNDSVSIQVNNKTIFTNYVKSGVYAIGPTAGCNFKTKAKLNILTIELINEHVACQFYLNPNYEYIKVNRAFSDEYNLGIWQVTFSNKRDLEWIDD